MKLSRLRVGALVGSLVLGTLVVASGGASAKSLTPVTFAYDFPGPDFELVPLVVAQEHGFFTDAGLSVKVVFPPDTSTTTKLLAVGRADIGMLTTSDMGVAVNAGAPVLSVANYSMHNNWALFAKPGVSLKRQDPAGRRSRARRSSPTATPGPSRCCPSSCATPG